MQEVSIFISYSSNDSQKVDEIINLILSFNGVHNKVKYIVWQDKKNIRQGFPWWDEIIQGIKKSNLSIFIISKKSVISKICLAELSYLSARNRFIIPIVLEGEYSYSDITKRNEINKHISVPTQLSNRDYIFYNPSSFIEDFEKIINQVLESQSQGNWKDNDSPAPLDPTDSLSVGLNLYLEGYDLAYRSNFSGARENFRKLLNTEEWGDKSRTWINIINSYEEILREEEFTDKLQTYYDIYANNPDFYFYDPKGLFRLNTINNFDPIFGEEFINFIKIESKKSFLSTLERFLRYQYKKYNIIKQDRMKISLDRIFNILGEIALDLLNNGFRVSNSYKVNVFCVNDIRKHLKDEESVEQFTETIKIPQLFYVTIKEEDMFIFYSQEVFELFYTIGLNNREGRC